MSEEDASDGERRGDHTPYGFSSPEGVELMLRKASEEELEPGLASAAPKSA